MHPTIIKALADELIADRTHVARTVRSERRLGRRLRLAWASR